MSRISGGRDLRTRSSIWVVRISRMFESSGSKWRRRRFAMAATFCTGREHGKRAARLVPGPGIGRVRHDRRGIRTGHWRRGQAGSMSARSAGQLLRHDQRSFSHQVRDKKGKERETTTRWTQRMGAVKRFSSWRRIQQQKLRSYGPPQQLRTCTVPRDGTKKKKKKKRGRRAGDGRPAQSPSLSVPLCEASNPTRQQCIYSTPQDVM